MCYAAFRVTAFASRILLFALRVFCPRQRAAPRITILPRRFLLFPQQSQADFFQRHDRPFTQRRQRHTAGDRRQRDQQALDADTPEVFHHGFRQPDIQPDDCHQQHQRRIHDHIGYAQHPRRQTPPADHRAKRDAKKGNINEHKCRTSPYSFF